MTKNNFIVLIIAVAVLLQPCVSAAQSDWEFYFFGVNLKTFQDGNLFMVATGAASSLLAHELGHALYLESQGKDWNFTATSSGLGVHTDNYLTKSQYRNFGRSGFAFQAGIGAVLTSFKSTKHLDFTKGWVSMNAAQLFTYEHRKHDNGDDFELIEKGKGDKRLDYGSLALITQNNLSAIESFNPLLNHMSETKKKQESKIVWHFAPPPGQEQTEARAWTPSQKTTSSLQQDEDDDLNYADYSHNINKNSL